MMTSALRSRQLNPVNSVQIEAVALRKSRGSPRKVNFDARTIPWTGSVKPRALASCGSEIREAEPPASQRRDLPGGSEGMFARIFPPETETPRPAPTRPNRKPARSTHEQTDGTHT